MRDGAEQPRRRPRRDRRPRARRRPRQWRPRTPRRLLHGVDGDGRDPGLRLRHPLRPRPLPPGDQGRPADRTARRLAVAPQSLGVRAARGELRDRLRRHGRGRPLRRQHARASSGSRRRRSSPSPSTRRSSAGAAAGEHASPVERARGRPDPPRGVQPRRLYRRARRPDPGGDDHPRPLSGRLDSGRTGTAAPPGILLHLGVAAGHRPPPLPAVRHGAATCRTRSPSSSTTPTRRSRSRS